MLDHNMRNRSPERGSVSGVCGLLICIAFEPAGQLALEVAGSGKLGEELVERPWPRGPVYLLQIVYQLFQGHVRPHTLHSSSTVRATRWRIRQSN